MSLPVARFAHTSDVTRLLREGTERVEALPGVTAAGAALSLPLESDWLTSFAFGSGLLNGTAPRLASLRIVSPGFLTVFEVPLARGRLFTEHDDSAAAPVALVNETMARRIAPAGDALTQRITQFAGLVPDDNPPREIVGIVRDVRDGLALNEHTRPTIYVPMAQMPIRQLRGQPIAWVVRAHTSPSAISATVVKALQETGDGLALTHPRSMEAVSSESTARTTFETVLMAIFGGAALFLAAIGVYGVTSYAIQQRAHEIGIRLALGAEPSSLRRRMAWREMGVVIPGVLAGLVMAFGLVRVLSGLLFGITAHDPAAFIGVPILLSLVAFVAAWIPTHRILRIDPIEVLRGDQ